MRNLAKRFWSHVKKTSGCWEWQRAQDKDGYGLFKVSTPARKMVRASRFAWEITYGRIRSRKWVLHKCDNPSCCRPSHLFIGTALVNSQDCIAKGRIASGKRNGSWTQPLRRPSGERHGSHTKPHRRPTGDRNGSRTRPESRPRGDNHGCTKISDRGVRALMKDFATGKFTKTALAKKYRISNQQSSNITLGRQRQH